jgi:hypothetical protein
LNKQKVKSGQDAEVLPTMIISFSEVPGVIVSISEVPGTNVFMPQEMVNCQELSVCWFGVIIIVLGAVLIIVSGDYSGTDNY